MTTQTIPTSPKAKSCSQRRYGQITRIFNLIKLLAKFQFEQSTPEIFKRWSQSEYFEGECSRTIQRDLETLHLIGIVEATKVQGLKYKLKNSIDEWAEITQYTVVHQTAIQLVDSLSLSELTYDARFRVIKEILLSGRFDPDRINGAPGNPIELRKLNDLYLQYRSMGIARLKCRYDKEEVESMSHAYTMMY